MQFDQARIAIRERPWLDNLDLALHVIRWRPGGIATAALAGIAPLLLVNFALVRFLIGDGLEEGADFDAVLLNVFLVMIEAPLATAPLTLYLGQALFLEHPRAGQIARDFVWCLPQLVLFQLLLRAVLIVPVITWIVPYALWPYLNEVILLERNPLIAGPGEVSTMRRNSILHAGGGSTSLGAQAFGAGLLALLLTVALLTTKNRLLSLLFGYQEGVAAQMLSVQLVLWIVAVFFTVARFLSYLDQRIRGEGWEVELSLRAQRDRLMRHAA